MWKLMLLVAAIPAIPAAVKYGEMECGAPARAGTMKVTLRVDGKNVTRSIDVDEDDTASSKAAKLRDAFAGYKGVHSTGSGPVAHFEVVRHGVPESVVRITRSDSTGEADTAKTDKIVGSAAAPVALGYDRELAFTDSTWVVYQGEPLIGQANDGLSNGDLHLWVPGTSVDIHVPINSDTSAETAMRSVADQLIVHGYEAEVFVGLRFPHEPGMSLGAGLDDASFGSLIHASGASEEDPW